MHLSHMPFCYLCGDIKNVISCDIIKEGKKDEIVRLVDQYITAHLLLPNSDKLCVCYTCKIRLKTWDDYILECKKAQEKLKEANFKIGTEHSKEDPKASSANVRTILESPPKAKKSSNYCIARWCNMGNHRGVSLFRLPRERARALIWLSKAERDDLMDMNNLHSYYLCANHFLPNMFTNKACNQLIKRAVPTVFSNAPYSKEATQNSMSSRIIPTQLQGVHLRSILPKAPQLKQGPSKLMNQQQEKPLIVSDQAMRSISAEPTPNPQSSENMIYIVSQISSPFSPQSCYSFSTSSENNQQENVTVFYNLAEGNALPDASNDTSVLVQSESAVEGNAMSTDLEKADENNSTATNLELPYSEQEQSFTTEPSAQSIELSLAPFLCINEDLSDSMTDSKNSARVEKGKHHGNIEAPSEQSEYLHVNVNRQHSVGSQDFLLPHMSEEIEKSTQSSEQIFALTSDTTIEPPSIVSLTESHGTRQLTMSLFDTQTDDSRETDSSHLVRMESLDVDEFMDYEQYFGH